MSLTASTRPVVTRAEERLLSLARLAAGHAPRMGRQRLLVNGFDAPRTLGPTARRLLADTLSRGVVLGLAGQGGWRSRGDVGRLWERHPAPPLHFTGNVVRLLQWVLSTPLGEAEVPALVLDGEWTPAEEAWAVLLLDAVRHITPAEALWRQPALRRSPLVVLVFAAELGRAAPLGEVPQVALPQHGVFLEGLSRLMARALVDAERAKPSVSRPEVLFRLGDAQQRVLFAFLDVVEPMETRHLASPLVEAAAELLAPGIAPLELDASLDASASLSARSEARRQAGALLRAVTRVSEWHEAHRTVRFVDDGYDEAQALLRAWAPLGEAGFAQARARLEALTRLPAVDSPAR